MVTTPIKLTFEEYLNYDDGTDNRYELVDGELVMVPLPSAEHSDVIDLLRDNFRAQIRLSAQPWIVKTDVGVWTGTNPDTGKDRSRTPDACVVTHQQWAALKRDNTSSAVLKTSPLLVVEVVSPGTHKSDYQTKRQEYQKIQIAEYWIVDPQIQQVTVLKLVDGEYQATVFTGNQAIVSDVFPQLELTAAQVFDLWAMNKHSNNGLAKCTTGSIVAWGIEAG